MREKLIEIVEQISGCANEPCMTCEFYNDGDKCVRRHNEFVADHLIANGVTVTDNNVGGKWISVKERLPEVASTHKTPWDNYTESIRVLCACLQADGKRMVKEGYCKVYEGYEADPRWKIPGTIHSVTHWMPLPEPPKGE